MPQFSVTLWHDQTSMIGDGFIVLALAALTLGTFLLGWLFWGRFRIVRLILWVASGFLLFLAVGTPIQHYFNNKAESKALVGIYYLDPAKSIFNSDSLSKYSDAVLTVRDNNTFELNNVTPLFSCTTGKWSFDDDGDIVSIQCAFDNPTNHFQVYGTPDVWKFEDSGWGRKTEVIYFTRNGKIGTGN